MPTCSSSCAASCTEASARGLRELRRLAHAAAHARLVAVDRGAQRARALLVQDAPRALEPHVGLDRKSTRLNSSHLGISYAVFCLKKKKKEKKLCSARYQKLA